MADFPDSEGAKRRFSPLDPEIQRERQFKMVEQAVVDAESGRHIHSHGGSLVWCNWDPTCEGSRPISELLS